MHKDSAATEHGNINRDENPNMRGLSDKFMHELKHGWLWPLLEAARTDHTLCFEIRNNYANIYYRGGNLCRIEETPSGYKLSFDANYAIDSDKKRKVEEMDSLHPHDWVKEIPFLKGVMDEWFTENPKAEREVQQLILRDNNDSAISNGTDYFITDIEYANSDNGSRFDMAAAKWPSTSPGRQKKKELPLAFIEVKYGDNALAGKSGLVKHVKDLYKFLNTEGAAQNLCTEMARVYNQKVELELLPSKPGRIESISAAHMEFIFLIVNHKPASTVLLRELIAVSKRPEYESLRELGCEIKIATASMMGYGLYAENMIPLSEYLTGKTLCEDAEEAE